MLAIPMVTAGPSAKLHVGVPAPSRVGVAERWSAFLGFVSLSGRTPAYSELSSSRALRRRSL